MKVAIAAGNPDLVDTLRAVIGSVPQHVVLWAERSSAAAVGRCASQRPDVLMMCLGMPDAEVIEATRAIMKNSPCGIIVVSTSVERDSATVFAAMGAGALDVVAVPAASQITDKTHSARILQKIRMAGTLSVRSAPDTPGLRSMRGPLALVAIGASSGGPPAVAQVLRELPSDVEAAVIVVQHIDPKFAASMAEWLGTQCALDVRVARHRDRLERGCVYLVAGEHHFTVSREGTLDHSAEARPTTYRPSADVLLESIARNWPGTSIGVILSGMGRDGAIGLRRLRDAGARTIAQDQATSAVYGMPRAAAESGATTDILPLPAIGPLIRTLLETAVRPGKEAKALA